MSIKSLHVKITGKVQGVCYRAWTRETALEIGLSGWVRNMPDRSVEAVFAGRAEQVDLMLDKCRSGPPAAEVTAVELLSEQIQFDDEGFEIKY